MHDGPTPLDFNLWVVRNAHRTVLVDTSRSTGLPVRAGQTEQACRLEDRWPCAGYHGISD